MELTETGNANEEKDAGAEQTRLAALDKQYVPFPSFPEWVASTSIDESVIDSIQKRVENLKSKDAAVLNRARGVATRAAAIDTGAIEDLYEVDRGFTYTVAVETGAWESALNDKGNQFKVLFEAQLHAYEYILDWATTAKPITEVLIRTLHQEICEGQLTYKVHTAVGLQEHELPKGEYKKLPNHVLQRDGKTHSYCPVAQTLDEMQRLIRELSSEEFNKASAIQQAAYAHYAFVATHPFADGNGRVARALASVFTYRHFCAPLLVLIDNRDIYFDSLGDADSGNYQPLVEFTVARIRDSVELIEQSVQTAEFVGIEESIGNLRKKYYTPKGFTHTQIDAAALEIGTKFCEEINSISKEHDDTHWSIKVDFNQVQFSSPRPVPTGYRRSITNAQYPATLITITINTRVPQPTEAKIVYELLMPDKASAAEEIVLWRYTGGSFVNPPGPIDQLSLTLDSCIPKTTFAAEMKLRMFTERALAHLFFSAASR